MNVLEGAFNQEKALVGPVIEKTNGSFAALVSLTALLIMNQ